MSSARSAATRSDSFVGIGNDIGALQPRSLCVASSIPGPERKGKRTTTRRWQKIARMAGAEPARLYAAALIDAPTLSMISPISFSLMMSGGMSSIVSPAGRIMMPASKNEWSSALTDALAGAAGDGRQVDRAGEADAADVDDIGQALEPHDGVIPLGFERLGALEQALVAIDVERRQRRRASERMARIGVAVEELDRAAPARS